MKIEKNTVVSLEYTLKNSDGDIIDSSKGNAPLEYIHGYGNLISGLEKELEGHSIDDSFAVAVAPADAYGEYDKSLLVTVPKSQFDTDVEIQEGMQFQADSPAGSRIVTVAEVKDDSVVIDANHPLAGQKLFFDVTIKDIREAAKSEIDAMTSPSSGGCSGCGGGCSSGGCGGGCGCGGDDSSDGGCDCSCSN